MAGTKTVNLPPSLRHIDVWLRRRENGLATAQKKKISMTEKGVEFKGGSLHDGFGSVDGFGGSGEHLALLLLVLQDAAPRDDRDGFGGFGGCGGFGRDGYPP